MLIASCILAWVIIGFTTGAIYWRVFGEDGESGGVVFFIALLWPLTYAIHLIVFILALAIKLGLHIACAFGNCKEKD